MKLGQGFASAANHSTPNLEEITALNAWKPASTDRINFRKSAKTTTASLILTSLQNADISARANYLSNSWHSIYSASRQQTVAFNLETAAQLPQRVKSPIKWIIIRLHLSAADLVDILLRLNQILVSGESCWSTFLTLNDRKVNLFDVSG